MPRCPQPCTTYHAHFDTLRELQVEPAVSDPRIFLIQFKKLALLEEQDGIEVVLLDLPELKTYKTAKKRAYRQLPNLLLKRSELFPRFGRDVESARIVGRCSGSISIFLYSCPLDFQRGAKEKATHVLDVLQERVRRLRLFLLLLLVLLTPLGGGEEGTAAARRRRWSSCAFRCSLGFGLVVHRPEAETDTYPGVGETIWVVS